MKDDPSQFLGAARQRLFFLVGLLAFSFLTLGTVSIARAQTTGSSSASDVQINLDAEVLGALTVNLDVGPLASVAGVAPPPYNLSQTAIDLLVPLLGELVLSAEVLNVNASSNVPGTPESASANANVAEVLLNLLGLVTLDAANPAAGRPVIQSTARVTGPCGGTLKAEGSTTIVNAVLGGLLAGNVAVLPNPAPNTVLLDISLPGNGLLSGRIRVILNEQDVGGNGTTSRSITVNAIHIAIEDVQLDLLDLSDLDLLDLSLLGLDLNLLDGDILSLDGDIIIAQSKAALTCAPAPEQPKADLSITKTGPATVLSNGQISYTVTATNNGPNAANNVVVADNLPVGTTFVSATAPCTQFAGIVTCNLGTLNSGTSVPITIVVTAPTVTQTTCVTNTATVGSSILDPGPGPNQATVQTCVNPAAVDTADVSITKTGPATVLSNGQIAYTVTVTNNSPTTVANNVSVVDPLPAGTTFVSATAPCTHNAGIVTCNLGTLNPNASVVLTIVVTAPTVATQTCINNTATVGSSTGDPSQGNNAALFGTCVNPPPAGSTADVSITKTAPASILVGQQLTYVLTITNNGPGVAQNVTITDTLPADVNIESVTVNPGTVNCVAANPTITCGPIATLASGAQVTVTIKVRPTKVSPPTGICNTATVSSNPSVPDSNTTNNTIPAPGVCTIVNPNPAADPDLSVSIVDSPDPVVAGNNVTYTLTVANGGPANSSGSTVTISLPTGTTFVSATPSQGSCGQPNGPVLICTPGAIANGANMTITIVVTPTVVGLPTLVGVVAANDLVNEPDDNLTNNVDAESTTVNGTVITPPPGPADGPDLTGVFSNLRLRCKVANQGGLKCKLRGGLSVRNQGTDNAPSSSVTFFLSADSTLDNSDIQLRQKSVRGLKVGKTRKVKLRASLLGDNPSGMFVIAVIAGGGDANPANNVVLSGSLP